MKKENISIQHFNDPSFKKPRRKGGRPQEKSARKHIICTRLSSAEMESVEKALFETGLSRSDAIRLVLLDSIGKRKLPQRIYGGISRASGEVYLMLFELRDRLRWIETEMPARYSHCEKEELLFNYTAVAAALGKSVEKIAEVVIQAVPQVEEAPC